MTVLSDIRGSICLALIATALLTTGCKPGSRRIDSRGPETITTVGNLDIQDATDAAGEMSASLLESGVLGKDGKPSIIAIDRYINNTSEQIDRDEIIKKIRVSLNKAGVAQTTTTLDSTGQFGGESTIATSEAKRRYPESGAPSAVVMAGVDYALTFKILDDRVRAGNVRQTTYTFQMSLTDVKTGLAVWEDEKQITKQGNKPTVGW